MNREAGAGQNVTPAQPEAVVLHFTGRADLLATFLLVRHEKLPVTCR